MIKSIEINFSFGKLLRNLDNILKEDLSIKANDFAKAARDKIIKGKVKPKLKTSTEEARKKSKVKRAASPTTPLYHTGRLLNSIKPVKDGIKLLEYGLIHNDGFTHNITGKKIPPRRFLFTGGDNLPPELKKKYKTMEKLLYKGLKRAMRK